MKNFQHYIHVSWSILVSYMDFDKWKPDFVTSTKHDRRSATLISTFVVGTLVTVTVKQATWDVGVGRGGGGAGP